MRKPLVIAAFVLVVGATAAYALASGARPGAPVVFLALTALTLGLSLLGLSRSAAALLAAPADKQVRVATGRRRKELEREKQSLLKALKELQFDHEMRKISDADYQEITAVYRARATRVMRQLDDNAAISASLAAAAPTAPSPTKASRSGTPGAATRPVRKPGKCGACGSANDRDAAFCKRCGGALDENAAR